jgi:hypothetical protein
MIEATQSVKKQAAAPEPAAKGPPRAESDEREVTNPAPASTELQVPERQKQVTPPSPSFDVRLDAETMRLYSELRDPQTDRVILRLPAGYQPSNEEGGVSRLSTEA